MKFAVLIKITGNPDERCPFEGGLVDVVRTLESFEKDGLSLDADSLDDPEHESEYDYLRKESPDSTWCSNLKDIQAQGILDKKPFTQLVNLLGAWASDTPTLGTMGGPLGACHVPDVDFETDDPNLLVTMRVTPVPDFVYENRVKRGPVEFDRLAQATVQCYGIDGSLT